LGGSAIRFWRTRKYCGIFNDLKQNVEIDTIKDKADLCMLCRDVNESIF